MPQSCAVPFCSEKKGGHKFPKDETVLKLWLLAIRRDNYTPTKYSIVCRKHFNPDDYELPKESYADKPVPRLKPNSVPSRFSWNHKSEDRKEIKRKRAGRALQRHKKRFDDTPKERDPLFIDQCRFCAEFSKDCIIVSANTPYLANNKTTLVFNNTSIQLDFDNNSLPKTVCRVCDAKLQDFSKFAQVVKASQETLIATGHAVQTVVKTEHDSDVEAMESPANKAVKSRVATKKSVKIDTAKSKTVNLLNRVVEEHITSKKKNKTVETAEDRIANVDKSSLVEIRFENKGLRAPRFLNAPATRVPLLLSATVKRTVRELASTALLKKAMGIGPKRKIGEINIDNNQKKTKVKTEECEYVEIDIEPIEQSVNEISYVAKTSELCETSDLKHGELKSDCVSVHENEDDGKLSNSND